MTAAASWVLGPAWTDDSLLHCLIALYSESTGAGATTAYSSPHTASCDPYLQASLDHGGAQPVTSAVKQSFGFTIGFHNHGEGPY